MNLSNYIKKLRAAADSLEELLYEGNGAKTLGTRIAAEVSTNGHAPKRRAGVHWTQKPEHQATVRKIARTARRAKAAPKLAVMKQRQRTATVLARFDTKEPRPFPPGRAAMAGVLVRRGYLEGKGKHLYVRTAKPFEVQP